MLVEAAEFVDLVLVLSANLNLVPHGILLLLRQLRSTLLAVIPVVGKRALVLPSVGSSSCLICCGPRGNQVVIVSSTLALNLGV